MKTKKTKPTNEKIIDRFEKAYENCLSSRTMKTYLSCLQLLLSGNWKITSKSKYAQYKAVLSKCLEIDIDLGIKLPKFSKRGDNFKENVVEKIVSNTDLENLIDCLPKTANGKQATLACKIALATGLRLSEVLNLKKEDIKEDNGLTSLTTKGKGGKTRTTFFKGDASILENFTAFSISLGYLELAFARAKKRAGVNFNFHSLRHTFATSTLKAGLPLASVQKLLGHSNISTTSKYLHLDFDRSELAKAGFCS
jgi:integrase/recombinase XerD